MNPPSLASSFLRVVTGAVGLIACTGPMACESGSVALSATERAAGTPVQLEEYSRLGYRVEWRGFPTMTGGEQVERLDVLEDVVAVQEGGSVVTVLEVRSGERRWSDAVASPLTKFVGVIRDGKRLIVSSETQASFYDIETGVLLDKHNLAQVVNTRPVQVGRILVYGCSNGQVLGHLMLDRGFRQWGSVLAGSVEVDPIPVGGDGAVALASTRGDLTVLDGASGLGRGRARMFGGPTAALAASESAVYVASADQSLYAFSKDGASELWRRRTDAPLRFAPTVHNGRVYCDLGSSGLTCLEAISGKEVWANKTVRGTVIGVRGGRLLVWDGQQASLLELERGATVESSALQKVSIIKTDKFVDGSLYIAAPEGVVTKLVPRN